jgi:hypothetical protein
MRKLIIYILILVTASTACKEKYVLPGGSPQTGYLVIDGVINSGQGSTTLRLTRTLGLVDSVAFRHESDANVRVEGDDNSTHPLNELQDGVYHHPQLALNGSVKYRLHINTRDGREYISDYSPVMRTPPIDSISWERPEEGVLIYVNTHDPQNKTLYYRWEYEETWQFHSAFASNIQFKRGPNGDPYDVEPRDPVESQRMYTCWKSENSTNLLIGSSARLSRDTIHLPLLMVPAGSWKISAIYSILVRQYATSRAGYEFLQRMKKNTEQVGSLFDAQPSELTGNVRCVSDPSEPVIGFVDVADAQVKRIFIRRGEVSPWNYRQPCTEESILNHPDTLVVFGYQIPTTVALTSPRGDTVRIFVSQPDCVDCRLRGTDIKPSFWP